MENLQLSKLNKQYSNERNSSKKKTLDSDSSIDSELQLVYEFIERECLKGKFEAYIYTPSSFLRGKLIEDGYSVEKSDKIEYAPQNEYNGYELVPLIKYKISW